MRQFGRQFDRAQALLAEQRDPVDPRGAEIVRRITAAGIAQVLRHRQRTRGAVVLIRTIDAQADAAPAPGPLQTATEIFLPHAIVIAVIVAFGAAEIGIQR